MVAKARYTLEILPAFEEELQDAVNYIQFTLRNPTAALKLLEDTFAAINERLSCAEPFERIPSKVNRKYPYYRIYVGNYMILYVVIGKVMEVRRFLYQRRDWHSWQI